MESGPNQAVRARWRLFGNPKDYPFHDSGAVVCVNKCYVILSVVSALTKLLRHCSLSFYPKCLEVLKSDLFLL